MSVCRESRSVLQSPHRGMGGGAPTEQGSMTEQTLLSLALSSFIA